MPTELSWDFSRFTGELLDRFLLKFIAFIENSSTAIFFNVVVLFEFILLRSFKIILTEGKKHQIRRMCAALGYQVQDLKRTRIMDLRLGKMKPGAYKEVTGLELLTFLKSIGAIPASKKK